MPIKGPLDLCLAALQLLFGGPLVQLSVWAALAYTFAWSVGAVTDLGYCGWCWAVPETLFAAYQHWWWLVRVQPERAAPVTTAAGRAASFASVLQCVGAARAGGAAGKWLNGWFKDADGCTERELIGFFSYGFFGRRQEELDAAEVAELRRMRHSPAALPLLEGFAVRPDGPDDGPDVDAFYAPGYARVPRPTNPLVVYQLAGLAHVFFEVAVRRAGFARKRAGPCPYLHLASPGGAKSGGMPVVLFHGIGMGAMPYLSTLELLRHGDGVGAIFVVELPCVSMRLWDGGPPAAPAAIAEAMAAMLAAHGHDRAVFIGHSYGSFVASAVLKRHPEIVAGMVMAEPVVFMLCLAQVARAFVFDPPYSPVSAIVRNDLCVSNALMRDFWWGDFALGPDEVQCPLEVFLTSDDLIVPVASVDAMFKGTGFGGRVVTWHDEETHGDWVFDSAGAKKREVVAAVERVVAAARAEEGDKECGGEGVGECPRAGKKL